MLLSLKSRMKLRVTTPMRLSCTLPPSCFTFFSLCSFRLYLDSVWFASARRSSGPGRSLALIRVFACCLASAGPRRPLVPLAGPHGYQPLVFTSDQVGGDLDKTTSKLKYPACLRSLGAQTRQFDSRVEEKDGGRLCMNTRRTQGSLHRKAWSHRNVRPPRRRFDAHVFEDLSKQNPNLSSSHVLRAEGQRRRKEKQR